MVDTLDDVNAVSNTYTFFTSDNGFHHGEHRVAREKWRPYEEDIQMPLVVRGPRIEAGSTTYKLALNTDDLPTFTELARVRRPSYVDGRSLKSVLEGTEATWRSAVLLEASGHCSPPFRGIRTISAGGIPKRKYVEYVGGAGELYHLDPDPHKLTNYYDSTSPPDALQARPNALKSYAADTCRAAENGP